MNLIDVINYDDPAATGLAEPGGPFKDKRLASAPSWPTQPAASTCSPPIITAAI